MWTGTALPTDDTLAQIERFNEVIDQIVSDRISSCIARIDREADLFTASVAHDLANPLDAVRASAHVLAASGNLSMKERAAVQRITRAASRLAGMLEDLRDHTRIRLGGLVPIECGPCDVGRLVREIVDEFAAAYPDRHVVTDCSGDLIAQVDAARTSRLVSNLVANALQHGTDRPHVAVYGETDSIAIDVHNAGPAMDPGRLGTLFEPFGRLPGSSDRSRLGLGLYIAHQIALAHRGTIHVTSTATCGTRFTVRLPRRQVGAS